MAKRKDDFSFSFNKKPKDPEPAAETPSEETPAESTESSADPFASSDTSSDPFASTDTASADPFASTEPSTDPFASTDASASSDPFTSTDASADPFASTETPAADPFASTDPAADPFAATDTAADPFASTETPTEAPAEEAPAAPATKAAAAPSGPPEKFRILILADLSGRTNRNIADASDLATRKVRNVDVDTLDKVLAAVKPKLDLPVSETSVMPLAFSTLEDFRPDAIINQVPALQTLLQLRSDLKDAKKFKDAAARVRKLSGEKPARPGPARKAAPGGGGGESDFERLLNQPIAPKGAEPTSADALIANLVAGYGEPAADPDQAKLVAFVEEAVAAGLRAILRHPAFQSLESAWRGIHFLTSRLNLDDDLKISVLDVSKDELYADLVPAAAVEKTGLFQVLVEQTKVPGTIPYSLVVGDYEFDQSPQSIALLAKIATLMSAAGLPFLAGAAPKIAGFPSFHSFPDSGKWQPPADAPMWDKIRGHKCAAHIGLAGPRFLLRLPYGPKTDAIDAFPFNEMPEGAVHDQYLWANGAYGVTYAIAQGFLENGGWGFEPGTDIDDLPCHMAIVDGDKEMTPCAEGWLSDRVGDILYNLGLIPLLSVRNAAAAKLQGVHSIAKGDKPLAATWASA